jgi:hypothetical protein
MGAFAADEDGGGRSVGAQRACRLFLLTDGEESWLRRRRRGCQVFIARKRPRKKKNNQIALSGIISSLTTKCGGNVNDMCVVEITASSVSGSDYAQNAGDLEDEWSSFESENKPGQWICLDFKALRIESTHYTIQTSWMGPNHHHLKSWAVEGSGDGASWTEIDQRENNSDLNGEYAMKTFAVSHSGSFGRIRLRQTGPNHRGDNRLALSSFELFGAVAGLQ